MNSKPQNTEGQKAVGVGVSKLTPKRERFAQEVASGKSQADAYRIAFNAERMKPETIQQSASRLMADRKVSARVQELREPVVKKVQITLESHLRDLEKLRDDAKESKQFSAAISAEVARGKASGLYVDKHELTGKDGGAIQQNITISFVEPNEC